MEEVLLIYRTEAPVRIGQALLLQAVAYRLQEKALGGLKPSTRRLLERTAENNLRGRTPIEAPATKVTPGSVLIREWHGVSHRVTVLADGVLLRGARYGHSRRSRARSPGRAGRGRGSSV